jgi:hypothetical protein
MNYRWNTFPNIGYVTAELTEDQLAPIWEEVKEIQQNGGDPANQDLAGQILREYKLKKSLSHIESIALELAEDYEYEFPLKGRTSVISNKENVELCLDGCWVNYQSKYENNPPHKHSGLYSFVIWLHFPFDIEEEMRYYPNSTSTSTHGKFNFTFTNSLGMIENHSIEPMKNVMCMFPSQMTHYVSPFYTSDGYRISVAGNIGVKK